MSIELSLKEKIIGTTQIDRKATLEIIKCKDITRIMEAHISPLI